MLPGYGSDKQGLLASKQLVKIFTNFRAIPWVFKERIIREPRVLLGTVVVRGRTAALVKVTCVLHVDESRWPSAMGVRLFPRLQPPAQEHRNPKWLPSGLQYSTNPCFKLLPGLILSNLKRRCTCCITDQREAMNRKKLKHRPCQWS